jgi:transposase
MLKVCCQNQLKWRYALADSWFSSSENIKYIHATYVTKLGRLFDSFKGNRQACFL